MKQCWDEGEMHAILCKLFKTVYYDCTVQTLSVTWWTVRGHVTLSLSAVLCWLGAVWQLRCQTVERCPSASRTEAGTRYFLEVWDRSRNRICILNTSLRDVGRKIWAPFVSLEPSWLGNIAGALRGFLVCLYILNLYLSLILLKWSIQL